MTMKYIIVICIQEGMSPPPPYFRHSGIPPKDRDKRDFKYNKLYKILLSIHRIPILFERYISRENCLVFIVNKNIIAPLETKIVTIILDIMFKYTFVSLFVNM